MNIQKRSKYYRNILFIFLLPFFLTGCSVDGIKEIGYSVRDFVSGKIMGFIEKSQEGLIKDFWVQETTIKSKYNITQSQAQLIEKWLYQQGLNYYGDPVNTLYEFGSPLIDKNGGDEVISRYDYIIDNHPELIDILGL